MVLKMLTTRQLLKKCLKNEKNKNIFQVKIKKKKTMPHIPCK